MLGFWPIASAPIANDGPLQNSTVGIAAGISTVAGVAEWAHHTTGTATGHASVVGVGEPSVVASPPTIARVLATYTDTELLTGPHVARQWFAELDLPSGFVRLHNGVGPVVENGYRWTGISDPINNILVAIESVEDPRFGAAPAVNILLAGINSAFWASVKADARDIEGRDATLYWAAYDPETAQRLIWKKMMPGKMTSPALHRQGVGVRYMTLTIESFWQSQNFSFGGRWNYADTLRRNTGDMGGQFIGQSVQEQWL